MAGLEITIILVASTVVLLDILHANVTILHKIPIRDRDRPEVVAVDNLVDGVVAPPGLSGSPGTFRILVSPRIEMANNKVGVLLVPLMREKAHIRETKRPWLDWLGSQG